MVVFTKNAVDAAVRKILVSAPSLAVARKQVEEMVKRELPKGAYSCFTPSVLFKKDGTRTTRLTLSESRDASLDRLLHIYVIIAPSEVSIGS